MSLSLERMRVKVRKPLGFEEGDPDLTNTDIDELLNISMWEIDNKFPFREKEVTVTFNTVAGTRNYDMPEPFDALISLSIKNEYSNAFGKLERMSTDVYENNYDSDSDSQGAPTHYVREGCFARLLPTPDKAYLISMKRLIMIEDITNEKPRFDLPRVWHEIIAFGAIWRGFINLGDIARANQIKNHQVALINTTVPTAAKEERDSRTAGLEVLRREY